MILEENTFQVFSLKRHPPPPAPPHLYVEESTWGAFSGGLEAPATSLDEPRERHTPLGLDDGLPAGPAPSLRRPV